MPPLPLRPASPAHLSCSLSSLLKTNAVCTHTLSLTHSLTQLTPAPTKKKFIRAENVKSLVEHVVERFSSSFVEVGQTAVLEGIKLKHDQNVDLRENRDRDFGGGDDGGQDGGGTGLGGRCGSW